MSSTTPTDDLEIVASYFDGGGQYLVEVNAARTHGRFTINPDAADPEVYLTEMYPIDRPELAEIDWAEWAHNDRYATTPEFTLMDETEIVRLDGIVYGCRTYEAILPADEVDPEQAPAEPEAVQLFLSASLPDGFALDDLVESIRASFDRAAAEDRESGVLRDPNGNTIGAWTAASDATAADVTR